VVMTGPSATRAATVQDRIVDSLREPGLDTAKVRVTVEAAGRRRRRMARGGLIVAVVLALLGGVFAMVGDDDPDSVRADGSHPTSTLPPASTSSTALPLDGAGIPPVPAASVPDSVPAGPVPPTTVPRSPAPAPTTTAPTTTAPPVTNQPMTVSASVVGAYALTAGRNVTIRVTWSDPDNGDPEGAHISADWGDPKVRINYVSPSRAACNGPGPAASASADLKFRYVTPGPHTVHITATTCGGTGTFAETKEFDLPITVGDATTSDSGGQPARVVRAYVDRPGVDPDVAGARLYVNDGSTFTNLASRSSLPITEWVSPRPLPMTLLRVPASAGGWLRLEFPGGSSVCGPIDDSQTEVTLRGPPPGGTCLPGS